MNILRTISPDFTESKSLIFVLWCWVNQINLLLALPLRALVWVYQKTFSPDHGPLKVLYPYGYCKFHPSCSQYAAEVLKQKGILGIPKIIYRLMRCHPWAHPQVDLP